MSYTVEKWGLFEVSAKGRSEGNPFVDCTIQAVFEGAQERVTVDGFYDGDGVYKARFMPSFEGEYRYCLSGSFADAPVEGEFVVTAPAEGNHGPVHVAATYHFAYEDGTPYYSVGTTCYVWTHQTRDVYEKTLEELSKGYFNKIRFCVMPKHFDYNYKDPETFPYVGTPMDNSVINVDNFWDYRGDAEGNDWDFTRFNPEHFRRIDEAIEALMKLGIEADLIVMHPYDRWGFSCMTAEQDDLYWKYVIARFAAYRNIWWSLANEYDVMPAKTLADWERYASIIVEKDPYIRLRSIHNCMQFYDYGRPWVTHCSVQRIDIYKTVEITDDFRERYKKPVVWDEIAYEGNINSAWGNISGPELIRRFWQATVRGGYAGHGETYESADGILWWSHGGPLHGESQQRIKFLHGILAETPGLGLEPCGRPTGFGGPIGWDDAACTCETPALAGSYYLFYYDRFRPAWRKFHFDDVNEYEAEVIDTWDMTITPAGRHKGKFKIDLPAKEYMAVRIRKV